jgi:S-adenosylmethionine:tRNA ribosyltransferase-isomerase
MAAAVSSQEDSKARMRTTTAILTSVRVDEFNYELPPELIAQQPLENRAGSRMLVVHRDTGRFEDRTFTDLPLFLAPGDCLILNDSRVLPSRLFATRRSGPARIEVFLIQPLTDDQLTWQALVRPGRKVAVGEQLRFSECLSAEVLHRGEHGERTIRFECDVDVPAEIDRIGHVPLPPYIRREDRADDRERYQTVYADRTGSVAAPTAGLHFTPEVLDRCRSAGAEIARVTLHVGLGTFAPIHAPTVDEVRLHFERYHVTGDNLDTIRRASRRIAVGTTSVRTVETVYANGQASGETNLFIHPGYKFRAIDAMLTNFHLPQSSLLMLVSAFAGRELALQAYDHAIGQRYRFFSYGDCMLIL